MHNKQYKLGAILSYISILMGNIVGIIYTPIMLRLLGQAEYGLYSLVGSMIAMLSIVDLGFGNASIRYISKYRILGDKKKEYSVNGMFLIIYTVIGCLTLIIGLISYYYIGGLFDESLTIEEIEKFKIMFMILVLNLAIGFPFAVFGSIIVAYEKFIFPKIIGIIRTLINPIALLTVLYMGYDSLAMVITNTIINIVFLWVNVYYCFKKLKIKIHFKKFDLQLLKEMFIYTFFIFLAIVVDKIYWTTDHFLLGIYSGTITISIFAIASQINMYYMQFSTAISGMFLPRITGMVIKKSKDKELTDLFIKIGRIQLITLGLILTGFISFGKEFILLWAGPEYHQAYIMAIILITPFTIPLIQNTGITILQAKNLHGFRSIVLLFIAFGNIIISIPLVKLYGGIGAALGTAISMIIGNILIMNIYYYKKIKIDILKFWFEISRMSLPIWLCLLVGFLMNILIDINSITSLIIKILLYSFIYSILMYAIGMNTFEKNLFSSLIRTPISKYKQKPPNKKDAGI
ncbi:oligosaccharide flippase family protein [Peribacillus sp. NPDC097284]|uniref:oligosaccharide flippase family protein n=1 Tax=Peribacillus sp. NPDC097284 TaxID=3364401 RepID=UPI0037F390DA